MFSPLLRQHPSDYSTHCSTNWVFSSLANENRYCFLYRVNKRHSFFPWPQAIFLMYTLVDTLLNTPGKPSTDLRNSLYAALLTDILSASSSCFGFSWLSSIPSPQLRQFVGLSQKAEALTGFTLSVSSLSGISVFQLLVTTVLKTIFSLFFLFCFLRQEDKYGPIFSNFIMSRSQKQWFLNKLSKIFS